MGFGVPIPGMPGGGGGGLGDLLSSGASSIANAGKDLWSNLQQRENATASRNWNASMANTVHQREVADLIKAGLNPILSATHGGNPAATAPVAGVTPLSGGVSDFLQMKMALQQNDADLNLKRANADAADSSATLNDAKRVTELTSQALYQQQADQIAAQTQALQDANAKNDLQAQWYRDNPDMLKLRNFFDAIGLDVGDVFRLIKPGTKVDKTTNIYPSSVISPSAPRR